MIHLKPYIIPEFTVLLQISIISNIIPIHFLSEATTLSCQYLHVVRREKKMAASILREFYLIDEDIYK